MHPKLRNLEDQLLLDYGDQALTVGQRMLISNIEFDSKRGNMVVEVKQITPKVVFTVDFMQPSYRLNIAERGCYHRFGPKEMGVDQSRLIGPVHVETAISRKKL